MFHVCMDFCIVYSVGVCVNVCGVVLCCLFLVSGCCIVVCCDFCLLSVMRVIGGVPLWMVCVLCTQLLF